MAPRPAPAGRRLAKEVEERKKFEASYRELERKMRLTSATTNTSLVLGTELTRNGSELTRNGPLRMDAWNGVEDEQRPRLVNVINSSGAS